MNDQPRDDRRDREEREEFDKLTEGLRPPSKPWQPEVARAAAAARELGKQMWEEATDRASSAWPPAWLKAAATVAGLAVFIFVVLPLLSALAGPVSGAAENATSSQTWRTGLDLAHVVTDAVRTWLQGHAAGLPVGWDLLWVLWCATGITLLVLATMTAKGARIGWVLFGLGTAAMVYQASPVTTRWTAVGICGMWWILGSLFALRRLIFPPVVIPDPAPLKRVNSHEVRDACELMDALNHHLGGGGAHPANGLDLDVDGVAALVRETRVGLLTTREFAVDDDRYPGGNPWTSRLAPFIRPEGPPPDDETLVSDEVVTTMVNGFVDNEAHRLLADLTNRPGNPWRQGTLFHPGDPFGKVLAWAWHTDPATAMTILGNFLGQVRFHDPLVRKLIAKIRLKDLLDSLPMAMPADFSDDDLRALTARAHVDVPQQFDDDVTK